MPCTSTVHWEPVIPLKCIRADKQRKLDRAKVIIRRIKEGAHIIDQDKPYQLIRSQPPNRLTPIISKQCRTVKEAPVAVAGVSTTFHLSMRLTESARFRIEVKGPFQHGSR